MSLPTGISLTPDGYMLASAGRDKVRNQTQQLKQQLMHYYTHIPLTNTNINSITLNFRC